MNKLEIYKNYHNRVGWEFYISRTPGHYINIYKLHLRFDEVWVDKWLVQRCLSLPPEAISSSPLDFVVITGITIESAWGKGSRLRGLTAFIIEEMSNEDL